MSSVSDNNHALSAESASSGVADTSSQTIGSGGITLTRFRQSGFELTQPSLPQFTLSILMGGRSRPWRDLGDGYRIPKGAEAFRHQGTGIVTPHDTLVGWRVEGTHDCLVFSFPVETGAALLEGALPGGVPALYRLTDQVVRDPLLPALARDLWASTDDRIGRFQADHAAALILARLARRAEAATGDGDAVTPQRERLSPANLRRAQEFMRSHIADDPSLREIAAATGLSPYHFLRGFKATTGRTPVKWLQDLRIQQACALLTTTDVPIAQLALEVGFRSQSHFGVVFRRLTGTTPLRWRMDVRR